MVGSYVDNVLRFLDAHHGGEDAVVWPVLAKRSPAAAELLARMESQHAAIHELRDKAGSALTAWTASSNEEDGRTLASALAGLAAEIDIHFAEEEAEILPVASRNMSPEEWGQLPGHAMRHFTGDKIWLILGLVFEQMTPEQLAVTLAAPAASRRPDVGHHRQGHLRGVHRNGPRRRLSPAHRDGRPTPGKITTWDRPGEVRHRGLPGHVVGSRLRPRRRARRPRGGDALAQGQRVARRRLRHPPRRLLVRRLPAHRRRRAFRAPHGDRSASSPTPAVWCGASATASRSSARRTCCPARSPATPASSSAARWPTCASRRAPRRTPPASRRGTVLRVPVSHGEGRYVADEPTLQELELDERVIFRYVAPDGSPVGDATPNGSMHDIAGIVNVQPQRARHDAPPRTRLRTIARQQRRHGAVLGGGGVGSA